MLQMVKGRLTGDTEKMKSKESKFLTSAFSEEFQLVSLAIMDLMGMSSYHSEEYYFEVFSEPGEILPEKIVSDGIKIIGDNGVVLKSTLKLNAPKGINLELKKLKNGVQYYAISFKEGLEHRIINAPKEEVVFQVNLEDYSSFEKELFDGKVIGVEYSGDLKGQMDYIDSCIDVSKDMKYYFVLDNSKLYIVGNKDNEWIIVCQLKSGFGRDKGIPASVAKAMNGKEIKNLRFKIGAPYNSAVGAVFAVLTGESIPEGTEIVLGSPEHKKVEQTTIKQSASVQQFKKLLAEKTKTKGTKLEVKALSKEEEQIEITQEPEGKINQEPEEALEQEIEEAPQPAKKPSVLDRFKKGPKKSLLSSIKQHESSKMADTVIEAMQNNEEQEAINQEVEVVLTSEEKLQRMKQKAQEAVSDFDM